jgi:hypothetical protein
MCAWGPCGGGGVGGVVSDGTFVTCAILGLASNEFTWYRAGCPLCWPYHMKQGH